MPILGKIKERTAMDAAKVSDPRQLILNAPSFDHNGYAEGQIKEKESQMAQPVQPTNTMGGVAFNNTEKPVLEKWDLDKMAESQRNNYMQSFNTWADAEKAGDISQKDWANARIQKMIAEGKNPGEYENILSLYGDAETPEEKRKRERREALGETFRGLGNLIGNAANLYYTHRGGQYIDLNSVNEKHRERMQRIKDKQDALDEQRKQMLVNAKLGEIQAARKAAADKEQRAYDEKVRKENRAYQDKKDKQAQDNWNRQFEWNKEQAEQNAADKAEEKAYRREQDKNNLAYKWAELNFRKENAKNSSSGGKKDKIEVVNTKKGAMNVDFSKLSDAAIRQLYNKIPEEIRKNYDVSELDNRNERLLRMNEAIGDALENVDGYSDWFVSTGVGAYQQQQKKGDYSSYLVDDDYSEYTRKTGSVPTSATVQNTSLTADDIQAKLDANKRKKSDLLQAGKDSLEKTSGYGLKSDTFR